MKPRFLLLAALLVFRTTAQTQEVPSAGSVADRIGQTVEFQDEIKAVSWSNSTNGYYLSFGAPYPKQLLSVWVAEKLYDKLPASRALVGRVVRIKGLLEPSPTGPLLKLQMREDFGLLPVDEAILSKPTLDGKQERSQFKAAVWQTFLHGDFETLETLGQELRQSRERLLDGSWLSEAYFSALRLSPATSKERYAAVEERIAQWERAKPTSPAIPLIKIGYHLDLAWRWRTDRAAKAVSPEGWKGFKNELAIARQLLELQAVDKSYPEYYALMQTVALGQGWKKPDYMRLFAQATQLEPDYYRYYSNAALYLLPRWHGRKGEWEQFAEQQRQLHGAGAAGDALYAQIAWDLQDYYFRRFFRDTTISWDVMASGFDYLIKEYPDSRYLKNVYANWAWKADDRVRLRTLLPIIKSDPDMTVWVNLENVALAEKFANSPVP
ncbi:MAG TPA: hypothetical protein VLH83_10665, partial [Chthoniobacterales bacterium]|nr:hypothetical protein [Chthoniobacterales bacterium]